MVDGCLNIFLGLIEEFKSRKIIIEGRILIIFFYMIWDFLVIKKLGNLVFDC